MALGEEGLGEVTLGEVTSGGVTSGEVGLGEVTSGEAALGAVAVGEAECILASNEVFTRDCGCQMNDTGRRLDGPIATAGSE